MHDIMMMDEGNNQKICAKSNNNYTLMLKLGMLRILQNKDNTMRLTVRYIRVGVMEEKLSEITTTYLFQILTNFEPTNDNNDL